MASNVGPPRETLGRGMLAMHTLALQASGVSVVPNWCMKLKLWECPPSEIVYILKQAKLRDDQISIHLGLFQTHCQG